MSAFEDLAKSRYVNLETYRKDGTGVQTPVWVSREGANLVVFTNGDSYKVKRLRRNPKLRIARCGVRGALKGPWHDATATLVDDPHEKQAAIQAIRDKYGWQMTLVDLGARLGGSKKNWAVIAIRLSDDE
ncbi:MAG: PPOX class F420-dependent oxidoreductase [Myxococcales bacterium]|jgi:PPOX class probable F420-dependent enzyme